MGWVGGGYSRLIPVYNGDAEHIAKPAFPWEPGLMAGHFSYQGEFRGSHKANFTEDLADPVWAKFPKL